MKEFQEILKSLPEKEILKLKDGTPVEINLSNELFTITKEMIDIRVESKEGFNASYVGNDFVILNTTLDEELINEGLARETISKIQQIRKNNGFDIADRVIVYYEADESYTKSLEKYLDLQVGRYTYGYEYIGLEFFKKIGSFSSIALGNCSVHGNHHLSIVKALCTL